MKRQNGTDMMCTALDSSSSSSQPKVGSTKKEYQWKDACDRKSQRRYVRPGFTYKVYAEWSKSEEKDNA